MSTLFVPLSFKLWCPFGSVYLASSIILLFQALVTHSLLINYSLSIGGQIGITQSYFMFMVCLFLLILLWKMKNGWIGCLVCFVFVDLGGRYVWKERIQIVWWSQIGGVGLRLRFLFCFICNEDWLGILE